MSGSSKGTDVRRTARSRRAFGGPAGHDVPGPQERGSDNPQARSSGAPDERARVIAGLQAPQKRIASKYHYDERGSRLFEEITGLEEYYLTRTERALLVGWMPKLVAELRPATLVELGAGSAEKSRIILDAMVECGAGEAYVPVDVSQDFLQETASRLRDEYPGLEVVPKVADFSEPLDLPAALPHPRWVAFLGSTLGNFEDAEARELLRRVAERLREGDRFLLGVDLRPGPRKTRERVEAAYDDALGVTARFSLNILSVINDEFGSDFDLDAYRHRSSYNPEEGRIETFLVSSRDQLVRFPGGVEIPVAAGETIRTEISAKYDRAVVDELFDAAGLVVDRWMEDDEGLYALVLSAAVPWP